MKYSIVVPFHNEEGNVAELYIQTKSVMESLPHDFEFVFVDDGSTDRTPAILNELADCDKCVTVVRLGRNYGKTEALVAGFDHAEGEFIVVMDGDLQHDPAEIPLLLDKLHEGYDMVCGSRMSRPGDGVLAKQLPSRIANALMAKLSGVNIHDFGGGFKAFRSDLIKNIPLYGELQRFIPALASAYGARICEIPIHISKRPWGKSHYGLGRLIPVLFDLITISFLLRYMSRPMHFFGGIGLFTVFLSLACAVWLGIERLIFHVSLMTNHGPLLIFSGILFVAGLILLCLGLIGEMFLRKFHEQRYAERESHALRVVTRCRKD
jgi:glycosyltransferase involved in cell wall biosynthesis